MSHTSATVPEWQDVHVQVGAVNTGTRGIFDTSNMIILTAYLFWVGHRREDEVIH